MENLEDSLPSWISDHLGERSVMTDEVNQISSSPREDPPNPEDTSSVAVLPPIERDTNIRTPKELDLLRESYSFSPNVQIRMPRRTRP